LLAQVRALRDRNVAAWATMDAGPHVKVLTTHDDADTVAAALRAVPDVSDVLVSSPGSGATVIG
jgi:diphosphomevalonate decarboxylase